MRRDGEGAADVPVELHLPKERGDEIVVGAVAENGGEGGDGERGDGGIRWAVCSARKSGKEDYFVPRGGDVEFVEVGRSPICGTSDENLSDVDEIKSWRAGSAGRIRGFVSVKLRLDSSD